jgi:hypothetical protein
MNLDRRPDNHEAAMARADLYKLANYSMKLFKMIQEGQELEGWVQAKITKAADYIASVYHFMEYEMKVSEYGDTLENSDVYSESVRRAFQQKLMETKRKAEKLKKESEKVEEGFDDLEKYMKEKDKPKPSGGAGKKQGSKYGGSKQKDDEDKEKDVKEGFPTVADAKARHEKEKGTGKFDKKKISTGTVYTRKAEKSSDDEEDTPKSKKVKEGAKPDFLDMDKDGDKKEPMKKAVADKKKNPFGKKVEEDTRLAMRRGPGADMIRYEKDSPAPGAKKHRDDTAKAAKELRASGKKLGDDDEAKVGDKTVTRYNRDHYVKEVAMSPAPAQKKSGIPSTATTTVPGMRATPADLKKANSSAALGEGKCNHTAKGKKCPVHGLKECGSMYEAKNLKQQAAIAIAKKKAAK